MTKNKKKLFRIRVKCTSQDYNFEIFTAIVLAQNESLAKEIIIETMDKEFAEEGIHEVTYRFTLVKKIQFDYFF